MEVNALYALLAQLATVKEVVTAQLLTNGLLPVQLDHANYVAHCQALSCLVMEIVLLVGQIIHLLQQLREIL